MNVYWFFVVNDDIINFVLCFLIDVPRPEFAGPLGRSTQAPPTRLFTANPHVLTLSPGPQ